MCVRVIEWWKAINKEVFAKRFTHYVNVEENDRMICACKACYGAFSYKDNRNGARTFPHCKKYFTNKKCMYNHVESINGTLTEVMQANMCSENCYDIRKALKSAETLPCPACDTAFQQRKALSRDSSCYIVRGWNAPRDVMCTRTYVTRDVLDCHRKSHETVGEQRGNISDGVLFLASESALQNTFRENLIYFDKYRRFLFRRLKRAFNYVASLLHNEQAARHMSKYYVTIACDVSEPIDRLYTDVPRRITHAVRVYRRIRCCRCCLPKTRPAHCRVRGNVRW